MKKLLAIILGVAMALTAVGCSASKSSESSESASESQSTEIMDVRFVLPRADSAEMSKVTDAINAKLKEDGLPLNFVPLNVPANVYNDRINLMFAGNQEFELLHVMENVTPFQVYVNNGYIIPIDDLLQEYGSNILSALDSKSDWMGTQLNGETYTIPNHWKDITKTGAECGSIGLRMDKLEEYGLSVPTTMDELFETAKTLKEKWGNKDAYLWMCNPGDANVRLQRGMDRYPFYVDYSTSMIMIFQDGTTEPYLESAEFKQEADWMHKAYQAGLIHPDVLTITTAERNKIVNAGISLGGNLGAYDYAKNARDSGKDPNYTFGFCYLSPEKAVLESIPALNTNAVSSTSPHPEAGIMFLNWLYSDQANMDLLVYGIEGVHYTKAENGRFNFVRGEDGNLLYDFKLWQVGQASNMRIDANAPEEWEWFQTEPADNVEVGVAKGFVFDPTPVQSQYQAIVAELPGTIYPIKMGVVDYDSNIDAALDKLKSLGYDKVVAEYQKQFAEYYSANF